MYRNLYDTDVTVWSPQGRLFQVEYAMEGVKLGTCAVGVRSKRGVVLAGQRRSVSKLASNHTKLAKIDDHCGLTFSGISADAKHLLDFMRKECLAYRYVHESPMPIATLVSKVGYRSHANTQNYSKRPYGCGLLVAGVDGDGPHLYETCPSGRFTEYFAFAFGSRCQSSKTFLEKNFETFADMSDDDLIFQAVQALAKSVAQDEELTPGSISVGIVTKDVPWKELTEAELVTYLQKLSQ